MADVFTKEKRSVLMGRVHGKNTRPEKIVRSMLHRMGFRFRLHVSALPGKPDVVLPKYRKVLLIHGCFWHGHRKCSRSKRPSTNEDFWNQKIDQNIARDRKVKRALRKMGWGVLEIWECQANDELRIRKRLKSFLNE